VQDLLFKVNLGSCASTSGLVARFVSFIGHVDGRQLCDKNRKAACQFQNKWTHTLKMNDLVGGKARIALHLLQSRAGTGYFCLHSNDCTPLIYSKSSNRRLLMCSLCRRAYDGVLCNGKRPSAFDLALSFEGRQKKRCGRSKPLFWSAVEFGDIICFGA
jgi:hypothetical protein